MPEDADADAQLPIRIGPIRAVRYPSATGRGQRCVEVVFEPAAAALSAVVPAGELAAPSELELPAWVEVIRTLDQWAREEDGDE